MCKISSAQEDNVRNKIKLLYADQNYKHIITSIETKDEKYFDGRTHYLVGKAYEKMNIEDSALIYYQKALSLYKNANNTEKIAEINSEIYEVLRSQNNIQFKASTYFDKVYDFAKKTGSKKWLRYCWANIGIKHYKNNLPDSAKLYFDKALLLPNSEDDLITKTNLFSLLGTTYSRKYIKHDSAIYYYEKALKNHDEHDEDINTKFNLYNNIGNAYRREKEYNKALVYYSKAENIELIDYNKKSKQILYKNISHTYCSTKIWEKAYYYLKKHDSIKELINVKEQNTAISKIKEQYDNEKLRADNLESENKRKKNRNLLIGAIAFILFGGSTMLLIQKNTRKKQKLAEQEKALETQKLATVLKEQELVSIDAMIEGQEKERQRIANDLHDDLGGLMATVKLHFNALKDKQTPELFDKTTTLLDDAYQKIRSIAHTKNSGVIAKQGLLIAVQNMADKVSVSNKINVDVVDHGLEHRLENSLELTIFRIIQELITNVIKHAEASEATIHLTNHEDALNIMIEDNGKGFNTNQVTTKHKGMGISSIDKRVEHLGGVMTIESETNKGTTVIIDIPT